MRLAASDKNEKPRNEPAKDRDRSKLQTVKVFWLGGLFGIALVTLVALAAGLFAWLEDKKADRLHQLVGSSAMVAHDIETRVTSLRKRLREFAADPDLRAAFSAQSDLDMRAKEERLMHRLAGAQRVRLLKPDVCEGKGLETEPLSYAGRDLVCQAERQRDITLLEIHRLGGPKEHLAIAAPVVDAENEAVVGVLHVALPSSLLPSLEDASGEWGTLRFQQRVADSNVTLEPASGTSSPPGSPDHLTPIEGTSLRIAAWVDGGRLDARLLLRVAFVFLVLVVLLGLAAWLPLRGLRRALVSDCEGIVALVENVANGKPARLPQCRLAETRPLIEALAGLPGRLPPPAEPTPEPAENKIPAHGDQADATSGPPGKEKPDRAEKATDERPSGGRSETESVRGPESVPPHIFRAYDVRGIVNKDLTPDMMYALGLAVGTEASEIGDRTVIVGRDTRPSSRELSGSLVKGLRASGRDVLDLGMVPTPLVYFATRYQGKTSGAMVTASHNPEDYNGLKVVVGGATLAEGRVEGLRERILYGSFSRGDGDYQAADLVSDYVGHVGKDVAIARTLKVVIDCGNAATSLVAPQLYRTLGCELVELDCDPSAGFPDGRVPDPSRPECLEALQYAVVSQAADLGLAFDSDGGRLGVVDSSGKIIWPDRVLMLLAADVLSRHPGSDVVFDVKSSQHLASEILRYGGRPVMWKSGHAPLKAKLWETDALLAGGWSGHIIFRERWFGFDDALYAGARLLEVLALDPRPSAEVFAELPESITTPEYVLPLAEGQAAQVMKAVLSQAERLMGLDRYTEDGLRMESEQGWGLVRASNSLPALVFRFEADDEEGLSNIQVMFRRIMGLAAPELQLPF